MLIQKIIYKFRNSSKKENNIIFDKQLTKISKNLSPDSLNTRRFQNPWEKVKQIWIKQFGNLQNGPNCLFNIPFNKIPNVSFDIYIIWFGKEDSSILPILEGFSSSRIEIFEIRNFSRFSLFGKTMKEHQIKRIQFLQEKIYPFKTTSRTKHQDISTMNKKSKKSSANINIETKTPIPMEKDVFSTLTKFMVQYNNHSSKIFMDQKNSIDEIMIIKFFTNIFSNGFHFLCEFLPLWAKDQVYFSIITEQDSPDALEKITKKMLKISLLTQISQNFSNLGDLKMKIPFTFLQENQWFGDFLFDLIAFQMPLFSPRQLGYGYLQFAIEK